MAKIGLFAHWNPTVGQKVTEVVTRQAKYVDPGAFGERIVGPLNWNDEEGFSFLGSLGSTQ